MAKLTLGVVVAWFLGTGLIHAEIPISSPEPGHGTSTLRVLGAQKSAIEPLPATEMQSGEVWVSSSGVTNKKSSASAPSPGADGKSSDPIDKSVTVVVKSVGDSEPLATERAESREPAPPAAEPPAVARRSSSPSEGRLLGAGGVSRLGMPLSEGLSWTSNLSKAPLVSGPVNSAWLTDAKERLANSADTRTPSKADSPKEERVCTGLSAAAATSKEPSRRRDFEAAESGYVPVPAEVPRDTVVSSRPRGLSSRHPAFQDIEVERVDFRQAVTADGQTSLANVRSTTDLQLGRELDGSPAVLPGDQVLPADGVSASPSPSVPLARISEADPRANSVAPRGVMSLVSQEPDEPKGEGKKDASTRMGPFEVVDHTEELTVVYRRSKLLRTDVDVYRTAVVDPTVCDVIQYTPREISVIGLGQGATHVTFWFDDDSYRPITYLVRVVPDPEVQERREEQYGLLEEHLAELFPESKVQLLVMADKLIVKGQARDAEEAAQILAVIRGQAVRTRDLLAGTAASPLGRDETNRTNQPTQVINMLRIPGAHQVALRVKIAELNRSAGRQFGVGLDMNFSQGELLLRSLLNAATGGSATILGSFDGGDINFGIRYLEQHGVVRMLSEPTLVTLSGRPATFIAGGEFAVPTTVGVAGAAAVTTDFRAFGAIITFLPVVLDKDNIRLEVAPEFSRINSDNEVNGTPGLDTRAVTTTVQMREGQTLAIAGLLDDSMEADNQGDLPWVAQIFGRRSTSRNETELLILVTPELVHPMDPEEVPPLPGFDVTEPNNSEFFLKGHIEGRPTHEFRSTVWPRLRRRYQAGGPEMISGPFGHGE